MANVTACRISAICAKAVPSHFLGGTMLPYCQATENNKHVIAEILMHQFRDVSTVLEIASGTGQHAVHMGTCMPHLTWQPSDLAIQLPGLTQRLTAEAPENVLPAVALDVGVDDWGVGEFQAVFSCNCVHIIAWPLVEALFRGVGRHLAPGGYLCLYGPYKYDGAFTTESNARFDLWLKDRDRQSGIRDFEAVDQLATDQGLALIADHNMPANNQLLIWQRQG